MVQSGSEWVRVGQSGSEWARVGQSGSEWFRVVQSGSECVREADLRRRVAGRAGAPPAPVAAHLVEKPFAHKTFVHHHTHSCACVRHDGAEAGGWLHLANRHNASLSSGSSALQ